VKGWRQKRSVMRRYNLTADIYDARYCEEQEVKYAAALSGLSLGADSAILDVGCGSGLFFSRITQKALLMVGIDVSRQLLLIAKNRTKAFANVHLVLADADHLPFKPSVFSHVFAFTVLQNMPDPAKTLIEMRLVARADAAFVVTALKAALSLEKLNEYLKESGLEARYLANNDALRCNVVTAFQR
jgi:ubiquinone/menaquinone biosynthesis C-methylase UbiE